MTRLFAALLVVGVGAVTAGCSSDNTSSSAGTSPPAVCSSADALQASVGNLRGVQAVQGGTAALEDAVAAVKSALRDVADDASSQYATQVDGLQSGFDSLQAAAAAAMNAPSADTLNTVTASVAALEDDVRAFSEDIASTC
jgi:hypothetical protein